MAQKNEMTSETTCSSARYTLITNVTFVQEGNNEKYIEVPAVVTAVFITAGGGLSKAKPVSFTELVVREV